MQLAPVVLFVYNRPWHTQRTVEALLKNLLACESELFVYSDSAKTVADRQRVDEVRTYIRAIQGFKKITIIEREENWGLANSIIDGVTSIINQYDKIIVIEDDLLTSRYFLNFMNEALDCYYENDKILSITGFSFSSEFMGFSSSFVDDVYFNLRPMSWGWATWKKQWLEVDWRVRNFQEFISSPYKIQQFNKGGTDLTPMLKYQMAGKIDSWYIRWCYHSYLNDLLTVYPRVSFVNNIGHDRSGVHCGVDKQNVFSHSELNNCSNVSFSVHAQVDRNLIFRFNKAFNLSWRSRLKRIVKRFIGR